MVLITSYLKGKFASKNVSSLLKRSAELPSPLWQVTCLTKVKCCVWSSDKMVYDGKGNETFPPLWDSSQTIPLLLLSVWRQPHTHIVPAQCPQKLTPLTQLEGSRKEQGLSLLGQASGPPWLLLTLSSLQVCVTHRCVNVWACAE